MIELTVKELILKFTTLREYNFSVDDVIKDHNFKQIYANIIECHNCKCQIYIPFNYFSHLRYLRENIRIISSNDILSCDQIIIKNIIE